MKNVDAFVEFEKEQNMLGYLVERHNILSSNLANADTPHYVAKDLSFSEHFQTIKNKAHHPQHFALNHAMESNHEVIEDISTQRQDGNGVDMEKSMTKLLDNRLRYETIIELVNSKFRSLREAARS